MVEPHTVFKLSKNLRAITRGHKVLLYNAFYGHGMVCHTDMLQVVKAIAPGTSMQHLSGLFTDQELEKTLTQLCRKGLIVDQGRIEHNRPYRVYPPRTCQQRWPRQ